MKTCKYCGKEVQQSRPGNICKTCDKKKSVIKNWKFKYHAVRSDADDKKRTVSALLSE